MKVFGAVSGGDQFFGSPAARGRKSLPSWVIAEIPAAGNARRILSRCKEAFGIYRTCLIDCYSEEDQIVAELERIRPDIVYVSISGFGESGPYADKRVYDPIIQALSSTDIDYGDVVGVQFHPGEDGTAEGTGTLLEIVAGPVGSNPRRLTRVGDRLFFAADNGIDEFKQAAAAYLRPENRTVLAIEPGASS